MKVIHRLGLVTSILAATVGCDQVTKQIAQKALRSAPGVSYLGGLFRLQYAENHGAFLSLGSTLPVNARFWFLTVSVGVLLLAILVHALRSPKLGAAQLCGYALIVGGGGSNWIDRARNEGAVVDFMNMGIGSVVRTGVFNVADLAIMVGIGLLLVSGSKSEGTAPRAGAPPS